MRVWLNFNLSFAKMQGINLITVKIKKALKSFAP